MLRTIYVLILLIIPISEEIRWCILLYYLSFLFIDNIILLTFQCEDNSCRITHTAQWDAFYFREIWFKINENLYVWWRLQFTLSSLPWRGDFDAVVLLNQVQTKSLGCNVTLLLLHCRKRLIASENDLALHSYLTVIQSKVFYFAKK